MTAANHRENIRIVLKEKPESVPEIGNFQIGSCAADRPGEGQFLGKNLYLSLDPYMRGQISGRHISGNVETGDVLRGETVCEVVESRHPDFAPGDLVRHFGGWQLYSIGDGSDATKLDPRISPPSLALGVLGMPGLTAYAGLLDLGEPKPGDALVVSAATGGVGSLVGQIGKIKGCRVVGIAGSDEKCSWAVNHAGFDACINHRRENVAEALQQHCPGGIDIYFDNVGGEVLEACMWQLAIGARVVLCGLMAQYNTDTPPPGPNPASIIRARATVRGMVVYDHQHKQARFVEDVLDWLDKGKITYREDVTEGLENAPESFCRLMSGQNFGKTIVKIS